MSDEIRDIIAQDCHFIITCPSSVITFIIKRVGRKERVAGVQGRTKERAQDPNVTGRVGDLADLIGHRRFLSRTIDA